MPGGWVDAGSWLAERAQRDGCVWLEGAALWVGVVKHHAALPRPSSCPLASLAFHAHTASPHHLGPCLTPVSLTRRLTPRLCVALPVPHRTTHGPASRLFYKPHTLP